jgi:hypothetical protein
MGDRVRIGRPLSSLKRHAYSFFAQALETPKIISPIEVVRSVDFVAQFLGVFLNEHQARFSIDVL